MKKGSKSQNREANAYGTDDGYLIVGELRKLQGWAVTVYEAANRQADKLDPQRKRETSIVRELDAIACAANRIRLFVNVELG